MKPKNQNTAFATVQGETIEAATVTLPPQADAFSRIQSLIEAGKPLKDIDSGDAFLFIKDRIEASRGGLRAAMLTHYSASKMLPEYLEQVESRLLAQYGKQTVSQMRQVTKNILPVLEANNLLSYSNPDGLRNISVAFGKTPDKRKLKQAIELAKKGESPLAIRDKVQPKKSAGGNGGTDKEPDGEKVTFADLEPGTMRSILKHEIGEFAEKVGAKEASKFLRTLALGLDPEGAKH